MRYKNTQTHTDMQTQEGLTVTQEPIWPVNFCTSRRKNVGLESSCNKLMFCRNLDSLPLAAEMDCLVLWCHVLGDAEASRKH